METLRWTAPRYLTRFRCLGGECEDNCCTHGWGITLDQADYERLQAALGHEPERFARACLRTTAADAPSYATLTKTADGRCTLLDADGLCAVHRAYGSAALADVCALYPRGLTRAADGVEVAGALSCPEAARLCLLAEDAVDLVPFDPGDLADRSIRPHPASGAREPYDLEFDRVRGAFLRLLGDRAHPFAVRAAAAATLAGRLDDFFRRGAPAFEPQRLTRALEDPGEFVPVPERDPTLALLLVNQILIAAMRACDAPKFQALLDGVYAPYLVRLDPGSGVRTLEARDVWAGYLARRDRWERSCGERIDRYCTNFAANWWLRHAYTASPTLLVHLLRLFVLVDALRFLLFGHPALDRAADAGAGAGPALDRAVVEACYCLSRGIEHSRAFREEIARVLERNGFRTLEHAALLLAM